MQTYKCLVVEDSQMMRQLLIYALSRLKGVTVVDADDGMEGLKQLSSTRFDLIIVDINMPVMDGLKLIKHARSDPHHKDVPVMVITTEGSCEDKERASQLGVSAYLTKPIHSAAIIAEVRKILDI